MKEKFKFEISRSDWTRGRGSDSDTYLLERGGGKCCLGFAALALGYKEGHIEGVNRPEEVVNNLMRNNVKEGDANLWFDGSVRRNDSPFVRDYFCISETMEEIIKCNDSDEISDEEREEKLKILFSKMGAEVDFVD